MFDGKQSSVWGSRGWRKSLSKKKRRLVRVVDLGEIRYAFEDNRTLTNERPVND